MDDLIGKTVKGYELIEKIEEGGMGTVYKAIQSTVGREVAIKIIRKDLASQPEFIRRFRTEAEIIARLEHLHITPLFDYWRDPDGAYLVMRWLRGGNLKEAINNGAFDVENTAQLLLQVCAALNAAHRKNVIHRDLKPGNILFDEEGHAYLADFGIAKDLAAPETDVDTTKGTPAYMSPELARSQPVTPQSDIYSMGIILYEVLTGKHPYGSNLSLVELIYKHLNDPVPNIDVLDPEIRDAVNAVIQKSTAKDPANRYADALEMAIAFQEAANLKYKSSPESVVELLTAKEQEILELIIQGLSNKAIADRLFVEISTVRSHIKSLNRKLRARSRMQLILRGKELNLTTYQADEAPTVIVLPEPDNPYKGLRAFQAADVDDFFGREALIRKLLDALSEKEPFARFMSVVGPSGSGKSSIVRAGLIPALLRGDLAVSPNPYIVEILPGNRPLDNLEVALTRITPDQAPNLYDHLQRDENGLLRVADLILPKDDSELIIIIDQFEELFTLTEDEQRREHFLNLLCAAVTDKHSRVRIIVTLRADFYDRPLHYGRFGDMIRNRMETVLPLTPEELESAIAEPARRIGVTFEDGLVAKIISEVNYQPGALPLLQYALTELFERRQERKLTHAAYLEIGGVVGALAKSAEELFNDLSSEAQETARQMFLRLVTLGEGVEDTRRRTPQSELAAITNNEDLLADIIDVFAEYRLLSLDNDPATRTPTVEVAHEAILREWERLRNWLNDSRADVRMQRQLAQMAQEWRESNQDKSFLLRGSRLENFEGWITQTGLAVTAQEREYLSASTAEHRREKAEAEARAEREAALVQRARKVLQGLVGVMTIAAIIGGALALFAFDRQAEAEDERDRAESAEQEALRQASIGIAALAEREADSENAERGVLLSLEALEYYPFTPQAQAALVHTVDAYRSIEVLDVSDNSYAEGFRTAKWSPDGRKVAAAGPSSPNTIIIWDVLSGEVLLALNKHGDLCPGGHAIYELGWSPDGSKIASSAVYGSNLSPCGLVVWNSLTGETIIEISDLESSVLSVDWSPDGKMLLTGHDDGTAIVWNAETGAKEFLLRGHTQSVQDARFSPDGDLIATASMDGTIRLWDTATGNETRVMNGLFGGMVSLVWSPDGNRLLSGGSDGQPKVWDVVTGNILYVLKGSHGGWINSVDWSSDGRFLATVSQLEATEKIWDAATGRLLMEVKGTSAPYGDFSPDDSKVLTGRIREYNRLFIWNISLDTPRLIGHTGLGQEYAAWSPDSSMIVTTGNSPDLTARVWDPETGEQLQLLQDVNPRFGDWSPDSQHVAIPDALSNTFYIWDVVDNQIDQTITSPDGYSPVFAKWSPDGTSIAGSLFQIDGVRPIYIWDVATQEVLNILQPDEPCMQAWPEWSPDGTKIVSACILVEPGINTPARIRDATTGEELLVLESEHGWTWHAVWSPDGKRLLVTYEQGVAKIWDAETGEVLQTYAGHSVAAKGGDWHPDGIYVVTGDASGVVKVWHSATGEEVSSFMVQGDALNTRWSPDGTKIIITGSGTSEPVIKRVWLSTDELIDHAYECCVTRELTPDERAQFGLPPHED